MTTYVVNNYLVVFRFADWSNPAKTGILTALLIVLAFSFWLKSLDARTDTRRTMWRALVVLVGFNIGVIALFAFDRWA
ncbi:hypothetical protein [Rhizobium fabae]|uniref:Uncharacterized protein n=1 Tax=Rhizobium fabae TaxID=573179 RepID=A0A7W6BD62_9HYPH|nr:hypothetical protein [Rhizobium fabae]MBB3915556.1 hypothetical protein [Rhizobium fabae]RUM11862.1 hypothetical protein EFB14_15855 [Rhizobium fabae]